MEVWRTSGKNIIIALKKRSEEKNNAFSAAGEPQMCKDATQHLIDPDLASTVMLAGSNTIEIT